MIDNDALGCLVSGSIDANEFGSILVKEFCRTEVPRGRIVDASTMRPWVVPHSGTALIEVEYECDAPTTFDVGHDSGVESIIKAMRDARTPDQRMLIFEEAVQSPYHFMTAAQGQLLLDELCGPINQCKLAKLCQAISAILPQLVNYEQCLKFVEQNLDHYGYVTLRVMMGHMYCALLGSPTGVTC